MIHDPGMAIRVPMPKVCRCPNCKAEGQHDPWCAVHLADEEGEWCDCGLRNGELRPPRLKPMTFHGSVDPKERPS